MNFFPICGDLFSSHTVLYHGSELVVDKEHHFFVFGKKKIILNIYVINIYSKTKCIAIWSFTAHKGSNKRSVYCSKLKINLIGAGGIVQDWDREPWLYYGIITFSLIAGVAQVGGQIAWSFLHTIKPWYGKHIQTYLLLKIMLVTYCRYSHSPLYVFTWI